MKRTSFFLCGSCLAAGLIWAGVGPASVLRAAEIGKPARNADKGEKGDRENRTKLAREQLATLSPDQRQKVMAALRHVWEDADVKAARQALKQASDTLKKTTREAVEETDPEVRGIVASILDKMGREGNPGPLIGARKSEVDTRRRWARLLHIPPMTMDTLPPEDRQVLERAMEKTMADPRVKEAQGRLPAAEGPTGKAAALRDVSQTVRRVAVELEPGLQAVLDRANAQAK